MVLDASASMATQAGGSTRFASAVGAARDAVTGSTTLVVADSNPGVVLRDATRQEALEALAAAQVTEARGDLPGAIAQATALGSDDTRIVVISDFAGEGDWRAAVDTARAQGRQVTLRQTGGGGAENVGIVDLSFREGQVVAAVENFGDRPATRTLRLGGTSRSVSLQPGDRVSVSVPFPDTGGELRLTPGDSFPVDDVAPVITPSDPTIDVLVLTNDRNRYLLTALSVIDPVRLTVREPPVPSIGSFDVIVFDDVNPNRVLPSTVDAAREVTQRGGGVAILAHEGVGRIGYGDLLLVAPTGLGNATGARTVADDPLVDGITFPPPGAYIGGTLRDGRALVVADDGSPLVATDARGAGHLLYYGYIDESSSFRFHYLYPVFWKRAVFELAGRSTPAELNHRTGQRLTFAAETTVQTPRGTRQATAVVMDAVGVYTVGDRRYGAALLSPAESNVAAPAIETGTFGPGGRRVDASVPLDLSPLVAVGALVVVLLELGYLRRRGDL